MSRSEVIINEQTLMSVSSEISKYSAGCQEMFEEVIRQIKQNSSEWNDEDYNSLLSAIKSFMADIEQINEKADILNKRINEKLSAVQELHSIKI